MGRTRRYAAISNFFTPAVVLVFFTVQYYSIQPSYSSPSSQWLHQRVLCGEQENVDYPGSKFPEYKFNINLGVLESQEEKYWRNYLNPIWPRSLDILEEFLDERLLNGMNCPNQLLATHFDYIRYQFRLLSLSLLFEAISDYQRSIKELNLEGSVCSFNWRNLLAECRPKSLEMKKFKERGMVLLSDMQRIPQLTLGKSAKKNWLNNIKKVAVKDFPQGITLSRLHHWFLQKELNLSGNNLSGNNLSDDNLSKIFRDICRQEQKLFLNICSENDVLYGVAEALELKDLLIKSNTFSLINKEGKGSGCLQRFVDIFKSREMKVDYLSDLLSEVAEFLQQQVDKGDNGKGDVRYLQGRIFIAGALKEFDEKGLTDFLFIRPTPTPKATLVITPPSLPSPVVTSEVLPTAIAVAVSTPPPTTAASTMSLPTPTPRPLSAFQEALAKIDIITNKMPEAKIAKKQGITVEENDPSVTSIGVIIDQGRFLSDNKYSAKTLKRLLRTMEGYKTQDALREMCKFDLLGSSKRPLGTAFLHVLLSAKDHYGLFNIQKVLGDEFYLENDLEKFTRPLLVKLNNREQDGEWELIILKQQQPELTERYKHICR